MTQAEKKHYVNPTLKEIDLHNEILKADENEPVGGPTDPAGY